MFSVSAPLSAESSGNKRLWPWSHVFPCQPAVMDWFPSESQSVFPCFFPHCLFCIWSQGWENGPILPRSRVLYPTMMVENGRGRIDEVQELLEWKVGIYPSRKDVSFFSHVRKSTLLCNSVDSSVCVTLGKHQTAHSRSPYHSLNKPFSSYLLFFPLWALQNSIPFPCIHIFRILHTQGNKSYAAFCVWLP